MTVPCAQIPWSLAPADAEIVDALALSTGLSRTTARVLVARGIDTPEAVECFLSPDLARDWTDPLAIPGMDAAASSIAEAVTSGTHIVVFGDFDLDGVSSAAVAARGLSAMGACVTPVVPHRFAEGYGLSPAAIERVMPLRPGLSRRAS